LRGGKIYDQRGDNILHGRENNDRSGENIFDWENSLKIIQRHVTRSRPITSRIVTQLCHKGSYLTYNISIDLVNHLIAAAASHCSRHSLTASPSVGYKAKARARREASLRIARQSDSLRTTQMEPTKTGRASNEWSAASQPVNSERVFTFRELTSPGRENTVRPTAI